jgi:hypothetical protein
MTFARIIGLNMSASKMFGYGEGWSSSKNDEQNGKLSG